MSFTKAEREEIRQLILDELGAIEERSEHHGSYKFLCRLFGAPVLTHTPVGTVLRHF